MIWYQGQYTAILVTITMKYNHICVVSALLTFALMKNPMTAMLWLRFALIVVNVHALLVYQAYFATFARMDMYVYTVENK